MLHPSISESLRSAKAINASSSSTSVATGKGEVLPGPSCRQRCSSIASKSTVPISKHKNLAVALPFWDHHGPSMTNQSLFQSNQPIPPSSPSLEIPMQPVLLQVPPVGACEAQSKAIGPGDLQVCRDRKGITDSIIIIIIIISSSSSIIINKQVLLESCLFTTIHFALCTFVSNIALVGAW